MIDDRVIITAGQPRSTTVSRRLVKAPTFRSNSADWISRSRFRNYAKAFSSPIDWCYSRAATINHPSTFNFIKLLCTFSTRNLAEILISSSRESLTRERAFQSLETIQPSNANFSPSDRRSERRNKNKIQHEFSPMPDADIFRLGEISNSFSSSRLFVSFGVFLVFLEAKRKFFHCAFPRIITRDPVSSFSSSSGDCLAEAFDTKS